MRSFPFVAEQLTHLVLPIILGILCANECNTELNTCWKIFIKYAYLLTKVVRNDNFDDALAFVCSLYGIGKKDVRGIDDARHSFFVKAKRDLDVLLLTQGALELHITRANYQAKIWPCNGRSGIQTN